MALYKLKDKISVAYPFQKHISLADVMTNKSGIPVRITWRFTTDNLHICLIIRKPERVVQLFCRYMILVYFNAYNTLRPREDRRHFPDDIF